MDETVTPDRMNNQRRKTFVGSIKKIPNFQKEFNKGTCGLNMKIKLQLVEGLGQGTLLLKMWGDHRIPKILGSNKAQGCLWQSPPTDTNLCEVSSQTFLIILFIHNGY